MRKYLRDGVESAALAFETRIEKLAIDGQLSDGVGSLGRQNSVSGNQSGFHRGTNAFAAFGIREPSSVANQKHTVIEPFALRHAEKTIGVTRDAIVGRDDTASALQVVDKFAHVARDFARVGTAESHIEVVVFAEDPSVTEQVATEEELGNFARNFRFRNLRHVHFEFDFLCEHRRRCSLIAKITGDGAEVSAGADEHARADYSVDEPAVARAFQ